jgi:hypothetical protein
MIFDIFDEDALPSLRGLKSETFEVRKKLRSTQNYS